MIIDMSERLVHSYIDTRWALINGKSIAGMDLRSQIISWLEENISPCHGGTEYLQPRYIGQGWEWIIMEESTLSIKNLVRIDDEASATMFRLTFL